MSFVDELDETPDEESRAQLFLRWQTTDPRGLYADLRLRRPILNIKPFVVVTRWSDVIDTLSRSQTFQVPYRPKVDDSVGPFMLARDNSELNWRDKAVMRSLLRWEDLPKIRAFARQTAAAALAQREKSDSVDIPQTVSRLVPLRVVQQFFGFPGPDDVTMLPCTTYAPG